MRRRNVKNLERPSKRDLFCTRKPLKPSARGRRRFRDAGHRHHQHHYLLVLALASRRQMSENQRVSNYKLIIKSFTWNGTRDAHQREALQMMVMVIIIFPSTAISLSIRGRTTSVMCTCTKFWRLCLSRVYQQKRILYHRRSSNHCHHHHLDETDAKQKATKEDNLCMKKGRN